MFRAIMPSEFSISEFPEFLLPNSELCQSSRTKALEKNSDRTIAQSLRRTMSLADAPSQFLYSSVSMSNIDEIDVEKMPHRRSESDSSSVDSALTLTKSESEVSSEAKKRWSFTPDARFVSDTIIGLSDGLTVPFALTAGLSALGNTKVVIYGGLAELTAGAISMGLGGYLGAKSEE